MERAIHSTKHKGVEREIRRERGRGRRGEREMKRGEVLCPEWCVCVSVCVRVCVSVLLQGRGDPLLVRV